MTAAPAGFFWRRIELHPAPGIVVGGLEDDVHRFIVRIGHDGARITDAAVRAERVPYSTCPAAGPLMVEELIGRRLDEVAALDPPSHCTHILDLALLCAGHAGEDRPVRFDLKIGDRVDGQARALLLEDDAVRLRWDLDGTRIGGPRPWGGRDLRRFSDWKGEVAPRERAWAAMMRRAVLVSGSRAVPADIVRRASDGGPGRLGACFTHQPGRQADAVGAPGWRRDFSAGATGPLQGFVPETLHPAAAVAP